MRFRYSLIVLAVCVLFAGALPAADQPFRFAEGKHKQGALKYVNGLPVLFMSGTPEEMAEQHGKLIGNTALPLADYPITLLRRFGAEKAWPFVVLAGRGILKHAPADHLRELNALIKQREKHGEAIEVGNAMLELRRLGTAGCSTFIVDANHSTTGGPLFGRNLDLMPMGVLDKFSIVKVVRPKGKLAFVAIGYPYLIGAISGMNEKGLAIATLDVYSSSDGSSGFNPNGTPMMFCFRRILEECTTVKEAEQLMREMKRTTWTNLAVCDLNDSAVFEITPKKVIARRGENGLLPCTNHFRSDGLATSKRCWRYDRLQSFTATEKLKISDLARMMHSVNQGKRTVQAMIFEPAAGVVHVGFGAGPATARPLKALQLKTLFAEADK